HCAFAGGLGFLGVSVYGHIVVGRDLLEPLLGSLRTAFFLGLGTDADSGRVDLLLGGVGLSCCAVGQILLLVAHGVPLFRRVVGDGHRHLVHCRSWLGSAATRPAGSTLAPSGSGIKAFDHGAFAPALTSSKRASRGCRTVPEAAMNSLIIPDQNPVHEEGAGIE